MEFEGYDDLLLVWKDSMPSYKNKFIIFDYTYKGFGGSIFTKTIRTWEWILYIVRSPQSETNTECHAKTRNAAN